MRALHLALPAGGRSVYIRFVLRRSLLTCAASTLLWSMAALSCAELAGLEEVTLMPGAGGAAGGQTQTTSTTQTERVGTAAAGGIELASLGSDWAASSTASL